MARHERGWALVSNRPPSRAPSWHGGSRAARRGRNDTATVAGLIADEYELLYQTSRDLVMLPAQLRAEAAALRDANAASPDWDTIGRLLQESYAALSRALSTQYARDGPAEAGHYCTNP